PEPFPNPPVPEGFVERMPMALDIALSSLAFTRPAVGEPFVLPLDFDPRGALVQIVQGTGPTDPVVFAGVFPGLVGSCIPGPTDVVFPRTGAGNVGLFPLARGNLTVLPDCSRSFTVTLDNVPLGTYTLRVGGIDRGTIPVVAIPVATVNGTSTGTI